MYLPKELNQRAIAHADIHKRSRKIRVRIFYGLGFLRFGVFYVFGSQFHCVDSHRLLSWLCAYYPQFDMVYVVMVISSDGKEKQLKALKR